VEPGFGQLKWDGRKLSMDLRGLVKVRGEFLLMCLMHNVKKVVKKVFQAREIAASCEQCLWTKNGGEGFRGLG
jgi:hypothetical protein